MADKTIGGCVRTPRPDAFCSERLNQELYWLRSWPHLPEVVHLVGEEDNSEWRQAIERRQLASERQLKALLQETERLREENAVLRIQASTSGLLCQRSRGQVANAEPESIYPGTRVIQKHAT
ncbi:hypothetical protein CK203_083885 [Vitis vinifera]|uniref:Uncharacterized protein n=1 Tax=Vitis vinifera TaxID=29760 RepID=A0A438BUB7_VITVI|nr:hypothetical protein CK203_083885 [Vitis vinifera]